MDTRRQRQRQREAVAPRQAANAGPSRNQMAAAAAANGRPNRQRALGDISNHMNAPGEANRRRLTKSLLSAQPQPKATAAADENTIAPAHPAAAVVEGGRGSKVGRGVSDKNKKLSKGDDTTKVTGTSTRADAETDDVLDPLMKRVDQAHALAAKAKEKMEMTWPLLERYERLLKKINGDKQRLESEKAHKEAQVQKLMEENVRLGAMLDNLLVLLVLLLIIFLRYE